LARVIDKGRAAIGGTLSPYLFFDCPLDKIFFEAVSVSRNEFLEVQRQACTSQLPTTLLRWPNLREALESKPEISDECFLAFAEARCGRCRSEVVARPKAHPVQCSRCD
jgi:hypothetical protein